MEAEWFEQGWGLRGRRAEGIEGWLVKTKDA